MTKREMRRMEKLRDVLLMIVAVLLGIALLFFRFLKIAPGINTILTLTGVLCVVFGILGLLETFDQK